MKILQLAPQFPYPADDGGRISIAGLFEEFSRQHCSVTMFTFDDGNLNIDELHNANAFGNIVTVKHSIKNTYSRILQTFFFNKSIYFTRHDSSLVRKALESLLNEVEFDAIHADHSYMAPLGLFAKELTGKPLGLRLHNVEWMIWHRYAESLPKFSPQRIYVNQQAKALKLAETEAIRQADVTFAITKVDRQRVLDLVPNANVITAPAGVDPSIWHSDENANRNPYELILATTYKWKHNVIAIKWFIDKVLPLVQKDFPNTTLTLLGKQAPEWLYGYKNMGVRVLGYVPRVQPYMNIANIYVAPLFVGSGLRIKIIEAMAMQLPVVATPVSAEGIEATREDGLFIAKNEFEYAQHIKELFSDYNNTRRLGKNASDYILKYYSWHNNVRIILNNYEL